MYDYLWSLGASLGATLGATLGIATPDTPLHDTPLHDTPLHDYIVTSYIVEKVIPYLPQHVAAYISDANNYPEMLEQVSDDVQTE